MSISLISRREAIRRAALLAGVAVSAEWLSIVDRPLTEVAAQGPSLDAAQAAIVAAVADRILPRTDTPGAVDVGVPAFINLLHSGYMSDTERKQLATGLATVEAAARTADGRSFASLGPDRQDAILRDIARAEEAREPGFFTLIRSATILGYFTSEEVGRKVLNYDPIPGRYDGCIPIEQVGRRNWTT